LLHQDFEGATELVWSAFFREKKALAKDEADPGKAKLEESGATVIVEVK